MAFLTNEDNKTDHLVEGGCGMAYNLPKELILAYDELFVGHTDRLPLRNSGDLMIESINSFSLYR